MDVCNIYPPKKKSVGCRIFKGLMIRKPTQRVLLPGGNYFFVSYHENSMDVNSCIRNEMFI